MNPPMVVNPYYTPPPYTQPDPTDTDQRPIIPQDVLSEMYKNGQMTNENLAEFLEASYMTKYNAGIYMAARGYEMDENLSGENVKVFVKYAMGYDQYGSPEPIKVSTGSDGTVRVDPNGEPIILDTTLTDKGTQLSLSDPIKSISDLLADAVLSVGLNKLNPREIGETITAGRAESKYGPINAVGHSLAGKLVSDDNAISGTKYIFNDGTGLDSVFVSNGNNSVQFRTPTDPASTVGTLNPGDSVITVPQTANDSHSKSNFTDYLRSLPANTTPPSVNQTPPKVTPVFHN